MAGILDYLGFGSPRRSYKSKSARLKSVSKKLDKKLADAKLQKQIETKRKRLSKLS